MQKARRLSGLTKNRDQGGGMKKQGIPPTIGINLNAMLTVRKQAFFCKCDPLLNTQNS